jgi:hypothetical protein
MFQAYVSMVSFIFRRMFRVFYLDVLKVDLREHMLQWSWCLLESGLEQLPATAEASPWVTVQVPKASRCLFGTHTQAGQVTGIDPQVHASA